LFRQGIGELFPADHAVARIEAVVGAAIARRAAESPGQDHHMR
jgi:hypothetical protein